MAVEVGPLSEEALRRSGLRSLFQRLPKAALSFPKRPNGLPLLLKEGFFERLLSGQTSLNSFPASDVSAAQGDLKHLSFEQLLLICQGDPPSLAGPLAAFWASAESLLYERLSARLGKTAEEAQLVPLIYGALQHVSALPPAEHWLLKGALLFLPSCEVKPLEETAAYCHSNLMKASNVAKERKKLHWEVHCENPKDFKERQADRATGPRRSSAKGYPAPAPKPAAKADSDAPTESEYETDEEEPKPGSRPRVVSAGLAKAAPAPKPEAGVPPALEQLRKELAAAKAQAADADRVLQERDAMKAELASTKATEAAVQEELARLKEELDSAQASQAALRDELESAQGAEAQAAQDRAACEAAQAEVASLKEELASAKDSEAAVQAEVAKLREELESAKAAEAQALQDVEALKEEAAGVQALQEQVASMKAESAALEAAQEETARLGEELVSAKRSEAAAQEELAKIREELVGAKRSEAQAHQELAASEAEKKNTEAAAQEELAKLREELEAQRSEAQARQEEAPSVTRLATQEAVAAANAAAEEADRLNAALRDNMKDRAEAPKLPMLRQVAFQERTVKSVSLRWSAPSRALSRVAQTVPPSPGSFASEDSDRLDLFTESLQRLSHQVRQQEDRQLAYHHQMVRIQGTLQSLQEDRETSFGGASAARLQTLERGQAAVAAGAQRAMQLALKAAEAQQAMCEQQDELQGRCSFEGRRGKEQLELLERRFTQLEEELDKVKPQSQQLARMDQHEASQRRSEPRLERALEELDSRIAQEVKDCSQRVTRLETLAREESSIQACERIERQMAAHEEAGRVHKERLARLEAMLEAQKKELEAHECIQPEPNMQSQERLGLLEETVRKHGQQLEATDVALADLQTMAGESLLGGCLEGDGEGSEDLAFEGLAMRAKMQQEAISRLEEQMQRFLPKTQDKEDVEAKSEEVHDKPNTGVAELRRRVEDLQEVLDEQRLTQLRQMATSLPELGAQMQRLGMQHAEVAAKTESFEVRLDLTRTNLETQEQRLQSLGERVDRALDRQGPGAPILLERQNKMKSLKQVHFDAVLPKEMDVSFEPKIAPATKISTDAAKVLQKVEDLAKEAKHRREDTCKPEAEAQAVLSGDDPLPESPAARTSISDFTGC
ncbi:unnamed protein product [Effrenium voratum]|nr:unnamed protein product [Effrenium voratum]